MANNKITIEIDGDRTFELEVEEDADLAATARGVFAGDCVVEQREDGDLTVHPVSRVTAVYVGTAPSRRIGFPMIPR